MDNPFGDSLEFDESLTPRTFERFSAFLSELYSVIVDIDALDFQTDQKVFAREKLLTLDDQAHLLESLFREMEKSIKLYARQRQNSRTAFQAGWEGFYHDLLTHLTEDQRAELMPIFEKMWGEESDF